jgi:hypothetical protein
MKNCFGTIYPDLQQIQFGEAAKGKVFQICINSLGASHRDRKLDLDLNAWDHCQQCDDFRSCYDFSTAKLQMQRVLLDF